MAIPSTRIGDLDFPHCSGMVRAEGSHNVFVNGRPWSRQGDHNVPHLLPVGIDCIIHAAPIIIGSGEVIVNGRGGGRIGDAIAGCTFVIQGSDDVFAG